MAGIMLATVCLFAALSVLAADESRADVTCGPVAPYDVLSIDPANGVCPDDHYVRLASGLDAADAAPIRGVRRGTGVDTLSVHVSVVRQTQQ